MGSVFDDDESAFETQPQTRPDGRRFHVVFNTENATDGSSASRYRSGDVVDAANLVLTATSVSVNRNDLAIVTFSVRNDGPGQAKYVMLKTTIPTSVILSAVPTGCTLDGAALSCTLDDLAVGESQVIEVALDSNDTTGKVALSASVTNEVASDLTGTTATASAEFTGTSSSGCTMSNGKAPFDPSLPLLGSLALAGLGLRRLRRS